MQIRRKQGVRAKPGIAVPKSSKAPLLRCVALQAGCAALRSTDHHLLMPRLIDDRRSGGSAIGHSSVTRVVLAEIRVLERALRGNPPLRVQAQHLLKEVDSSRRHLGVTQLLQGHRFHRREINLAPVG
jgi:hypothetical protein